MLWASDMVDMVSAVAWWVFIRVKDRAGDGGEEEKA